MFRRENKQLKTDGFASKSGMSTPGEEREGKPQVVESKAGEGFKN
jgi:hypothetical protein